MNLSLSKLINRDPIRWPWRRKPVRVEHVRYVKQQVIDPVTKAIARARSMNRDDLVARLER